MKRVVAAAIAVGLIGGAALPTSAAINITQPQVAVDGWVSLKTSVTGAAKDTKREHHWSVKLAKPACAEGDDAAKKACNDELAGVTSLGLTITDEQDKALRAVFGKKIRLTGDLSAATDTPDLAVHSFEAAAK